jgi:flagellar M-ring protein FliF
MPPRIQALLQNQKYLAIAGGVLALLIILSVVLFSMFGGAKGTEVGRDGDKRLDENQKTLATVPSIGKAIEIQALLARQGIHMLQTADGDKITLKFEDDAKQKTRDSALITLVQSGLMDNNVGLESFDKGDLTASREEKRIKLVRAQQGEMARLIKKIDPIEDASVSIAIPEQSLFRADEKPVSATVQVSLAGGTLLSRDKVKAITNLMVGSIQGLDTKHVSISDTNGHTYNSVLDAGSDLDNKIEDQDNYMKQKVITQLDRLIGAGNYAVTVSTELRQASKETMVQQFDPQGGVVSSKQSFNENLNSKGSGPGAGGPASSFLPNALANAITSGSATPRKDYLRNGVEVSYDNSKMQWVETSPVGMVEDISIAVTVDSSHFPADINETDLRTLIARAASPKVHPENVSIAKSDLQGNQPIVDTNAGPVESPPDFTWAYWAGGAILMCLLLIVLLSLRKNGRTPADEDMLHAQQELQHLRELATQQQAQIQATQQQTQMLLEAQQRQMEQTQALESSLTQPQQHQLPNDLGLQQTLEELREVVSHEDMEDDNLDFEIKNWIESS